jgi:hypothetical protein
LTYPAIEQIQCHGFFREVISLITMHYKYLRGRTRGLKVFKKEILVPVRLQSGIRSSHSRKKEFLNSFQPD